MPEYDVIGDVHGHYLELQQLLHKMDYVYDERREFFRAPKGRKAVFMMDLIDRGPSSVPTVSLVRKMIEREEAFGVLGNHELNAVLWVTPDPWKPGAFCRSHRPDHEAQHKRFLNEVEGKDELHQSIIKWFKTIPLFLKLDNYWFVHACWHAQSIRTLADEGVLTRTNALSEKGWMDLEERHSPIREAVDHLLKGPEAILPDGLTYEGWEGRERKRARIAWWNENPTTFAEAFSGLITNGASFAHRPYDASNEPPFMTQMRRSLRTLPKNERIFIGHIWQHGEPAPLSPRVCAVDYSVARGGKLVAYRTQPGETTFRKENFVSEKALREPKPDTPQRTGTVKPMGFAPA